MTKERQAEIFLSLAKDCQIKEGATDDDLAAMLAYKTATRGSKCIQACLGERVGLVSEEKKTSLDIS